LKALAVDVARNLEIPVAEMGLPSRSKPAPAIRRPSRRQRQRHNPPDILLTTPEQLALLLANRDARRMFAVRAVVLDELHALANSKRGDLLALGLARLERLAPGHRRVGLSATVADPEPLQRYLVPQPQAESHCPLW
jgi:ATP-dependent helicase Lhr and Lhr-like helicase